MMYVIMILSFLLISSCSTKLQIENSFYNIDVIDVYDGDTIKVHIKDISPIFGNRLSVRIKGIDTPEIRTKDKCEKKAAIKARELVKLFTDSSPRILLLNCIRGKYFRLVCDVKSRNQDIAKILIQKKLAYHYNGGAKKEINWCDH